MDNVSEALCGIESQRASIDDIDERIVALLNERQRHAFDIRALKSVAGLDVFDPTREEAIIEHVCTVSSGPLSAEGLGKIYATILSVSKETHA